MLIALLLILAIALPVILMVENRLKIVGKYLIFLWFISFFITIFYGLIFFGGVGNLIFLASPIILRILFKLFHNSKYIIELDKSISNIVNGFQIRTLKASLLSFAFLILFIYLDQEKIGIYFCLIILIFFALNIHNQINTKVGLFFILVTFYGFIFGDPDLGIQLNMLVVALSLFLVLIPLVIYKPFEDNLFIHGISFFLFILLFHYLKTYNEYFIVTLPSSLVTSLVTFSILILLIFLMKIIDNKLTTQIKVYLVPSSFLAFNLTILFVIKKLILTYPLLKFLPIILLGLKNAIVFLGFLLLTRIMGSVLKNTLNYSVSGNSTDYEKLHDFFNAWLGNTYGCNLFMFFFGNQEIKIDKKTALFLYAVLGLILFTVAWTKPMESPSLMNIPYGNTLLVLWGVINIISSTISIRAWYVQRGNLEQNAAIQDTVKIFFGICLLAIAFRSEFFVLYNYLHKPSAIISGVLLLMSIGFILIVFSSELSSEKEKLSFTSTRDSISCLLFLIIIIVTFNIALLPDTSMISGVFIFSFYCCSLICGMFVGRVSGRIFSLSRWFFKNSNILKEVIFLIVSFIFFKPLFPCMLFYFGLVITSRKQRNNV